MSRIKTRLITVAANTACIFLLIVWFCYRAAAIVASDQLEEKAVLGGRVMVLLKALLG